MGKKTKILLVDNDVDFIDLNKAVLENNGLRWFRPFGKGGNG